MRGGGGGGVAFPRIRDTLKILNFKCKCNKTLAIVMRATKLAKLTECNCPLFLRQLREKTKTKQEQYSFCTPNSIISSFDGLSISR